MLARSAFLAIALAFSTVIGFNAAVAGDAAKFESAAFAEAQKAGKSILVDVHATWCSTCKAQKAVLAELMKKPEFKDLMVFDIDFDKQKDAWMALGAQSRSTLIVYKGEKETGRSVGDTKSDSIETLLKSAM